MSKPLYIVAIGDAQGLRKEKKGGEGEGEGKEVGMGRKGVGRGQRLVD